MGSHWNTLPEHSDENPCSGHPIISSTEKYFVRYSSFSIGPNISTTVSKILLWILSFSALHTSFHQKLISKFYYIRSKVMQHYFASVWSRGLGSRGALWLLSHLSRCEEGSSYDVPKTEIMQNLHCTEGFCTHQDIKYQALLTTKRSLTISPATKTDHFM